MTSPGNKIGQILKLIYLRQYLSYSVDQILKISKMLMAIFSIKKFVASSKWRPFWKFWNIKHSFNLTSVIKRSSQIMPKKYFHDDDVIDGVTGLPQSRPSILVYKWNNNIFHDNFKTSKNIIINLLVHRYHELMTTIISIYIHDVIDDVTRLQNRSNFEIDISPLIFALQRRSNTQNIRNAHGYLPGIFNSQYNFR